MSKIHEHLARHGYNVDKKAAHSRLAAERERNRARGRLPAHELLDHTNATTAGYLAIVHQASPTEARAVVRRDARTGALALSPYVLAAGVAIVAAYSFIENSRDEEPRTPAPVTIEIENPSMNPSSLIDIYTSDPRETDFIIDTTPQAPSA